MYARFITEYLRLTYNQYKSRVLQRHSIIKGCPFMCKDASKCLVIQHAMIYKIALKCESELERQRRECNSIEIYIIFNIAVRLYKL